ncbi:hypothetical protein N5079_26190 [Planotetraspora sp. A-T 1434]|uniref:hypothetical protein n=1 Tax=Planotetraspora sp. A-T 1434 TaxID=2979219 RepID=UPI0021BF262E|nr:hypothetical protein [Planotetraspora sp. A-T 1434]MCT9933709.1 hypothetical protein [Planotetraspora sp. A-T 1434]
MLSPATYGASPRCGSDAGSGENFRRRWAGRDDSQSLSVDVMANRVTAGVFVATEAMRQALDERYGKGVVVLDSYLKPVNP